MLKVFIPSICQEEQKYSLKILLDECLGLNYEVEEYDKEFIEIKNCEASGKLTLDASFFFKANSSWLEKESLPTSPLSTWNPCNDGINANLVSREIPILYGKPGIKSSENHLHVNLDIFGSAFFMLSRYEELVISDIDNHERFFSYNSLASKEKFLDRPIVNEYLEILWTVMSSKWPKLNRRERDYRTLISCDVDHPFDLAATSLKKTLIRVFARVFRDKNPKLAFYDLLNYIFKKFDSDRFDLYHQNINWIMNINKLSGNKVCFNFIPIQTDQKKEDPNSIKNKKILDLISLIVDSGHEIGMHPGYMTFKFPENFKKSSNAFKKALQLKNIEMPHLGGRQHYLRYAIDETPMLWEENGFSYDSSLGYADCSGFRCGICYEYSMYDIKRRRPLKLKQRPLIVMDCTIVDKLYEGLGFTQKGKDRINYLKNICKKFNGDFTLLWHNSYFVHPKSKKDYIEYVK